MSMQVGSTLLETNIAPENTPLEVWRFLLETIIFRCYVSFREGNVGSMLNNVGRKQVDGLWFTIL